MSIIQFLVIKFKKTLQKISKTISSILFFSIIVVIFFASEGYTLEDFDIEANLNPFDYCHLTDVDYTAIVQDTSVSITEYLTFDVHASSSSNPFRELWRELPEEIVDGVRVTYDVVSVTQILEDGTEIPYQHTSKMYWEDEDYTQSSTNYWHHSQGSGRYPDNDESLLIYIPWTYRDKLTFKIEYTMDNASLKYYDCSELYLSMYSGSSIKWLKSFKAKIMFPDNIMPSSYYAYTFGTKNSRIPFTESDILFPGYHTFSIQLDEEKLKFNHHNRYIEFCLLSYGDDKHIFTQKAPDNLYTFDNVLEECIAENEYYTEQSSRFSIYRGVCLVACILLSYWIITNTKKKYQKIIETNQFCTPDNEPDYFRDIPSDLDPYFASELVFMKDPFNKNKEKQEEYAAILLSLVRKKYISLTKLDELRDWTDMNTMIQLNAVYQSAEQTFENEDNFGSLNSMPISDAGSSAIVSNYLYSTNEKLEPLSSSERLYYDLLTRYTSTSPSRSIILYSLQNRLDADYTYTNNFVKNMESKPALECGVMEGYFSQTDYDKYKKQFEKSGNFSGKIAFFLLVFVNLISYFTPMVLSYGAYTILGIAFLWRNAFLCTKAYQLILFTPFGANEQAKWRGLYNYLNSNSLMNEKEVHDVALWEKYLIYATAFGISEKVISAIKLQTNATTLETSPILQHHSYIHSSHFHSNSRGFGTSLHTSSRGGGFGGHGYGGGGRGGGGGGGGH